MANHASAKKRLRQNKKINLRNRGFRSAVRSAIKRTRNFVLAEDLDSARKSAGEAENIIAKAAAKGLYHKNNAQRKIKRLYAYVNKAAS